MISVIGACVRCVEAVLYVNRYSRYSACARLQCTAKPLPYAHSRRRTKNAESDPDAGTKVATAIVDRRDFQTLLLAALLSAQSTSHPMSPMLPRRWSVVA